ncbi:MAG: DEAD/DEAH box helicase family protein [Actinomycetota bacterium]|nr:DEAD/DEAH box helicase family protein [Actinomycetota bacterium]
MIGGLTPEQRARVEIDRQLAAAGWAVQDFTDMDLTVAERGIAVREFPTAEGPADYLLYGDKRALGTVEAKKEGEPLLGIETQSDRYARGFEKTAKKKNLRAWSHPLPFHYESTGKETVFANRLDPDHAPRPTFAFHRPETLIEVAQSEETLRQKLRAMPPLNEQGLRDNQIDAIQELEKSFARNRLKALTPQIMGSGKTVLAVAQMARLLLYARTEGQQMRHLFLVDRRNLGKQARDEFQNYVVPDDGRKFGELFNVQLLSSNHIDPAANVVISTIQRLYSILRGESDAEFDPASEDESVFEHAGPEDFEPLEIAFQGILPIEQFDFIWTDEAHRSIYGRWGQVLDYFDSFITGLTATPSKFTYGYFEGNVVAPYTYAESVIDGVNVDYTTYRIETEVSKGGATVGAGEWVKVRDKISREEAYKTLEDELTYDEAKLDRAVVAPDQLRTVVRTFRDKVQTEIFPGREEVPKTVFFCKHEMHAEDVLKVVREEFGRGSDFARKITYKTQGTTDQHIQDFRTDPKFRIAVTVDQIATGTDIKAVECLVFLRMVQSRSYFEQMKGRGVRKIDDDDFWAVTPGAREQGAIKDHFVIVDCVGLTDEDKAWAETRPLDRKPKASLKELLNDIKQGASDDDLLATTAARLTRLSNRLTEEDEQEVAQTAGASLEDIARGLVEAVEEDRVAEAARQNIGEDREPTEEELASAKEALVDAALEPLQKKEVREKLLSLHAQTQQLLDIATQDAVVSAGFVNDDVARDLIQTFEGWIKDHHDEYVALKAYYSKPYEQRPTLADIKELAKALQAPPLHMTSERLWKAYEALDESKVRGQGGEILADIVSLIRFAIGEDDELVPHADLVRLRFDLWMTEQEGKGRKFNATQRGWLMMVRDHMATSLTIECEDFDLDPFSQEGGLAAAYGVFGNDLTPLLEELNERLAV